MSVHEVAERTGLSEAEALLARQREYDESFIIVGPATLAERVTHEIELRGLGCTQGGRFYHVIGKIDKGRSCRYLIGWYRRLFGDQVVTLGIGDSLNDLPLLTAVDRPVLVPRPNGACDHAIKPPPLTRISGVGPVGWNRAILSILQENRSPYLVGSSTNSQTEECLVPAFAHRCATLTLHFSR